MNEAENELHEESVVMLESLCAACVNSAASLAQKGRIIFRGPQNYSLDMMDYVDMMKAWEMELLVQSRILWAEDVYRYYMPPDVLDSANGMVGRT